MNSNHKMKLISMVTVGVLLSPTVSFAGQRNRDFRSVCEGSQTLSDQQKAYCAEAKISMHTKDGETVKSVAFLAGSVATASLAFAAATGVTEAACTAISYGVTGAGLATDIVVGIKNNDVMGAFMKGCSTLLSVVPGLILSSTAAATTKAASRTGCVISSITLGLEGAMSVMGAKGARSAFDSALTSAKSVGDSRATQLNSGFSAGTGTVGQDHLDNGKIAAKAASEDRLCGAASNYTECLKNEVPEIAAITNSPELMGAINKRLNGQSFGDFLKNYDSEKSTPEAYVGAAMGIPASAMEGFSGQIQDIAKKTGAFDKYTPLAYKGSGPKPASVAPDMDFSKMMNDMLKQMNPDGTSNKSKDASELVFRQLDLLPADKIESRRDISLFARIGYRYRKKSGDVEQLNFAKSENQEARTPAQAK